MQLIESAPHEFAAHFLFESAGLAPFFACDRRIKDGGGSQKSTFEYDGETWQATLYYRDSEFAPPGATLATGTAFQPEEMREFDLHVSSADDPIGDRSFHAHITPSWQGMRSKGGNEISIPEDIGEGVNFHVQGSNIESTEYQPLIRKAIGSVGISSGYFRELH